MYLPPSPCPQLTNMITVLLAVSRMMSMFYWLLSNVFSLYLLEPFNLIAQSDNRSLFEQQVSWPKVHLLSILVLRHKIKIVLIMITTSKVFGYVFQNVKIWYTWLIISLTTGNQIWVKILKTKHPLPWEQFWNSTIMLFYFLIFM